MVGSMAANCPAQPDRRLHDVRLPDHVVPEDAQGAGVGFEQGGDAAHEGGLAGAVGPEHGQDRTLFREQLQPVGCSFDTGCLSSVTAMTNRDPKM
jgi:hypothetical protein